MCLQLDRFLHFQCHTTTRLVDVFSSKSRSVWRTESGADDIIIFIFIQKANSHEMDQNMIKMYYKSIPNDMKMGLICFNLSLHFLDHSSFYKSLAHLLELWIALKMLIPICEL